jgi:hypothetical protein
MIEIVTESKKDEVKKIINPIGLEVTLSNRSGIVASWMEDGDIPRKQRVESVAEVLTFPAVGDQRIWVVSNTADKGQTPELYLNQSRVIAFQVRRELEADFYDMIPVALGITNLWDIFDDQCAFLADINLRTISKITVHNMRRITLSPEETTTDILSAIQEGLKLPELTVEQLPIELTGIFGQEVEEKRNGTR